MLDEVEVLDGVEKLMPVQAALSWLAAVEIVGASQRAFAIVAIIAAGAALFLLSTLVFGSQSVERDLESRLSAYTGGQTEESLLGRIRVLRRFVVRAERMAERRGVLGQIETALEQANIHIRAGEAIAIAIAIAAIAAIVALVLSGSPITALIVAAIAVAIAALSVSAVAAKQRRRFEDQLPDTLNLVATSLRAGYSMLQALEAVSQEAPDPTAREFRRVITEIRLGRSVTEALQDSARRMESDDFDWVVLAFTIQREVGGNLAEVLQTTAETILQRARLRREMRALTAEGRISALVLGIAPFALFVFLYITNYEYLEPMLTSTVGQLVLVMSGGLLALGLVWLSRIIKVEV